jgi:hypothetical protein
MTISAVAATTSASSSQLVKLASGEYTADSVASDKSDSTRLGLVKEKDGNYGTTPPPATESAAAAQSSSTVQAGLPSLKLGGE